MLENRFILCFGKDWQESPTSNNHIMSLLVRRNTVIWFDSTGLRRPSLVSRQDLGKIFRKIKENALGLRKVKDNLFLYTPLVIPFQKYKLIRALNRFILRRMVNKIIKRFKAQSVDIWLFYPTAFELIRGIKRNILIYYCTDQWSEFSYLDPKLMQDEEAKVLQNSDAIFTSSQVLYELKKPFNANTFYMPHGVDFDFFSSMADTTVELSKDLRAVNPPIIGFYGLIQDWIDFRLIQKIAQSHPQWSVILIGKIAADISLIRNLPNVYFLGEKKYSELPLYSNFFDVAIIPYDIKDPRMQTVNPTKLLQYLASGLAVVAVDLPEVRNYNEVIYIAKNHDDFVKKIEQALKENNEELVKKRKLAVKGESWQERVEKISEIIIDKIR
jgi:glycosyltransferase involved in cell wall biosynthesis